jgi:hypothetical protein
MGVDWANKEMSIEAIQRFTKKIEEVLGMMNGR